MVLDMLASLETGCHPAEANPSCEDAPLNCNSYFAAPTFTQDKENVWLYTSVDTLIEGASGAGSIVIDLILDALPQPFALHAAIL